MDKFSEKDKNHSDSEDSQEEDSGLLEQTYSGRASPCFITVENEDGEIEQIQVRTSGEDEFSPPSTGAFFNSAQFPDIQQDEEGQSGKTNTQIAKLSKKELKRAARRRIVSKQGECNVQLYRVSKKRKYFLKDAFTTCVDMKWRYTLLAFTASFLISWLLFAVVWYLIGYIHGDFLPENLPDKQGESGFIPCVLASHNFASAFLFSVETQHTIGYGSRQTTEECPEAIILQCIQSIAGVIIQCCMAGIVFAKLSRPKTRANTITFSRNAVVTLRNGCLYLMFRVGNLRSSHLLESHVRAQLIQKVYTKEGESIHFHQEELKVGCQLDGSEDRAMLIIPQTFSHKIDDESPLWKLGPKDLLDSKFEIIVSLDGIIEPTGNSVQARSSYLPNEILWAHKFENIVSYAKHKGVYAVDCSGMNSVVSDKNTPRVSAKELLEYSNRKVSSSRSRSNSTLHLNGLSPQKKFSILSQMSLVPGQVSRISMNGDVKKLLHLQDHSQEMVGVHGEPLDPVQESTDTVVPIEGTA